MYLRRFLREHRILLIVSLLAYLLFIHFFCKIDEQIWRPSNPDGKILRLTPKLIRWITLGQLNGKLFYNRTLPSECCSQPLAKGGGYKRKYPYEYKFGGSELFNYPLHHDVLEQICRFKQRKSAAEGSYENRDFPLLIEAEGLCPENVSEVVDILILVKSSIDHTAERREIRNSWGNQRCWSGRKIRLAFVVAFTYKSNQMDWITKESQKYGDIIQQQFMENYYNTTHKIIFGLRWGLAFCPGARWYLFVDDDFFVNPLSVLRFLDGVNPHLQSRVVAGSIIPRGVVLRGEHKWGINANEYPYDRYPLYVAGGLVLISSDMALQLYIGSRFTSFLPFDDVFLGVIMNKLLIKPLSMRNIFLYLPRVRRFRVFRSLMALHGSLNWKQKSWIWKRLKLNRQCYLRRRTAIESN